MSRLEELIQKQRQFPIVDLHTVVKRKCSGATPAKGNREYYDGGNIPWLRTQDVRFNEIVEVESYITEKAVNETAVKWIPENCVIVAISGASAGRCAINKIRTTTNQHCLNLEIDSSKALYKYIYYCIANQYQELLSRKQGARGDLNSSLILSLKIPLPPLEVQREIVRVLDHFTELTTELTTELATELAARKKQYEYYRDQLLNKKRDSVEWVSLSDLGKWSGGKTPSMAKTNYWDKGKIPWISSKDMKASTLVDTQDHITEQAIKEASMTISPKNCIAIVTRSGILKHTFPVAYVPFETTVNQDIKILSTNSNVLPRYAFHVIQGNSKGILNKTKKQGGTVDSLEFQKVLNYKVPLPSLEEQQRIVDILDRFDTLCNDLTAGLPAEIEARQKQYEYYRDKLLFFKGLEV